MRIFGRHFRRYRNRRMVRSERGRSMICINLYGGPGIGKSTLAAELFVELKHRGIKSELVGEFAKELSYEFAYNVMADQHYLFAIQAHRLWRLEQSGVEVAVCDSPLLLNLAYDRDPNNGYFAQFVIDTYKRYTNFDYVLERNEHYWERDKRKGDVQDAIQMDKKIDAILLDVWHEMPEKLNPELVPAVNDIVDRVEDRIEEDKNLETVRDSKKSGKVKEIGVPYQDEPWKAA